MFKPPVMPEFPADYKSMMGIFGQYVQQQRPIEFLFEMFICDTLERLPQHTKDAFIDFGRKHPSLFSASNGEWKLYVRQSLHLSDTIDVAIWDLWITNSERAKLDGWDCHPWYFAQLFCQEYQKENSQIDVWPGNTLALAKDRIARYKQWGS